MHDSCQRVKCLICKDAPGVSPLSGVVRGVRMIVILLLFEWFRAYAQQHFSDAAPSALSSVGTGGLTDGKLSISQKKPNGISVSRLACVERSFYELARRARKGSPKYVVFSPADPRLRS